MILGDNLVAGDVGASHVTDFVSLQGLYAVLNLTNDAMAGYDEDGHIIIANDHFAEICGLEPRQLIGLDVRLLFLLTTGAFAPEGKWPFPLDGRECLLHCRRPNEGGYLPVIVRAQRLGNAGSFLIVCRPAELDDRAREGTAPKLEGKSTRSARNAASAAGAAGAGDAQAAEEIAHAERKEAEAEAETFHEALGDALRGRNISRTELQQFLGTGTHELSQTLFSPVVEELRGAVSADIAAIYLEDDGIFHLKAQSPSALAHAHEAGEERPFTERMPAYLENVNIRHLEESSEPVLGIIVPEPKKAGVGRQGLVTVGLATTGITQDRPAAKVPPLGSFYLIPLRFGTDAAGIVIVGWEGAHNVAKSERHVLYLLAQHLGTEIMNGLGTLRTRTADRVEQVMRTVRQSLELADDPEHFDYDGVFELIARSLEGRYLPLHSEPGHDGALWISSADGSSRLVTLDLDEAFSSDTGDVVRVATTRSSSAFRRWLVSEGLQPRGALVDVPSLGGRRRTFIVSRTWDAGPLESFDVTFLKRCLQDLVMVDHQREAFSQANYISQSLQRGMGNRLQEVPGISSAAIYNSATATASVGGDFYDLLNLPGRRACVILGDVAGKGVRAASVSSALRTALGAYAWEGLSPAHMVRLMNDFFMSFSSLETFASLFVGIVDIDAQTLTYCSAGHPPALLIHPKRHEAEFLSEQSGAVGAFREMIFTEATIPFLPGDEILLYSDGLTEARDPEGRFFGEEGLHEAVAKLFDTDVRDLPNAILGMLFEYTNNDLEDDCALMAVRLD